MTILHLTKKQGKTTEANSPTGEERRVQELLDEYNSLGITKKEIPDDITEQEFRKEANKVYEDFGLPWTISECYEPLIKRKYYNEVIALIYNECMSKIWD